jgi:hypothetical protein
MEPQTNDTPVLVGLTGPVQGKKWVLDRDEILIGRGEECDIVVPDRQVSRRHVRLSRTTSGFMVQDLESKNGTHLNGVPVHEPISIHDGDVLQIAVAASLTYLGTDATLPLSPEGAARIGLGRLRLDMQGHRVFLAGREIEPPLSPPQYRLLELLYRNPERVVPRDELVTYVWPDAIQEGVSEQAVDALVRRLRDRLATLDPGHEYILTLRGHGFRLHNPL